MNFTIETAKEAAILGRADCFSDQLENTPFLCIGGIDNRTTPTPPSYIPVHFYYPYLSGDIATCVELYGDKWRIVEFDQTTITTTLPVFEGHPS